MIDVFALTSFNGGRDKKKTFSFSSLDTFESEICPAHRPVDDCVDTIPISPDSNNILGHCVLLATEQLLIENNRLERQTRIVRFRVSISIATMNDPKVMFDHFSHLRMHWQSIDGYDMSKHKFISSSSCGIWIEYSVMGSRSIGIAREPCLFICSMLCCAANEKKVIRAMIIILSLKLKLKFMWYSSLCVVYNFHFSYIVVVLMRISEKKISPVRTYSRSS